MTPLLRDVRELVLGSIYFLALLHYLLFIIYGAIWNKVDNYPSL